MRSPLPALLLLVLAVSAWAEEETVDQLEAWLREPLLLSQAEPEEIAMLPWIDRALADAVVGLREAGGLHELEDLALVPGMDSERIEAIRPFVRLPSRPSPVRMRWEGVGRLQPSRDAALRSRVEAKGNGWWLGAQGTQRGSQDPRFAGELQRGGLRLLAGSFTVRGSWPLLAADPSSRARTAPPSLGRESRLVPRLSRWLPGWWGGGAHWRSPRWRLLAALGRASSERSPQAHLEAEYRYPGTEGARVGLAWRVDHALGGWIVLDGAPWRARVELAADTHRGLSTESLRGSAAFEWRDGGRRLGLALTQAAAAGGGQDPITAQALDREHRCWQLHGSMHRGRWSFAALARARLRGRVGDLSRTRRWQVEAAGPTHPGRLDLRFRLDEEDGWTSKWSLAADWREEPRQGSWGRALRLRRTLSSSSESLLMALELERGWPWFLRSSLAFARGSASSLWAVGIPGVGLSSDWLAPRGWGWLLALGHRGAGSTACLWGRLDSKEEAWAGGLGVRVAWTLGP